MERTRDEALRIGHEVAEKVAGTARACSCGMDMYSAQVGLASMDAIINVQQPFGVEGVSQLVDKAIDAAEEDCGVNLAGAKQLNGQLTTDIKDRKWPAARNDIARLRDAVIEPLREAALTPQKYLAAGGKKFKLVGEEPDENKASIWANNMILNGENIVVVPFQKGYALYREE